MSKVVGMMLAEILPPALARRVKIKPISEASEAESSLEFPTYLPSTQAFRLSSVLCQSGAHRTAWMSTATLQLGHGVAQPIASAFPFSFPKP